MINNSLINNGIKDFNNGNNFNVNTNHPLINSAQEYILYKKYVSIHSEDRDYLRFPISSEFEIDLPEDLLNVITLRLIDWSFPSNYSTFSPLNTNIAMTFKINNPYNPITNNVTDLLVEKIFECLYYLREQNFTLIIEEGFYNPIQMTTELTNKFNNIVTLNIQNYFTKQSTSTTLDPDPVINTQLQNEYKEALRLFGLSGGYNNFVIVYNNVSQKIWFGNTCDQFTLTNSTQSTINIIADSLLCGEKNQLPDYSNWGLPGFLGLTRCDIESVNGQAETGTIVTSIINDISNISTYNGSVVPRFYYGDVFPGDNGYWLLPNAILTGSVVYWIESPLKINLMGPSHMYMEIEGQNCIDETSPYNISTYTLQTNKTNGVVNSAFAKIPIPTAPLSQWFDKESLPYKFYYPPAERLRRFKFKIRYHNGQLVNFGVFNFSFVIEFTLQLPQILRKSNSVMYSPFVAGR